MGRGKLLSSGKNRHSFCAAGSISFGSAEIRRGGFGANGLAGRGFGDCGGGCDLCLGKDGVGGAGFREADGF